MCSVTTCDEPVRADLGLKSLKIGEIFIRVLPPDTFKTFHYGNIFDKTTFCYKEKRGMLVKEECSSRYNRVSDLLVSVWDKRKEILYGNGPAYIA